jgi:molybdate transport system substrate-binding protein
VKTRYLFSICALLGCGNAAAGEATIAVAANFAEVAQELKTDFERRTDDELNLTIGSTGMLYAQIKNGAPFDAMLAADQRRPRLLEEQGDAASGSRFTYAIGRLTLWSPREGVVSEDGKQTLRTARFHKLAIANPELAPYGGAARDTLKALGLYDALRAKIVMGANIGQAFAMVSTGNADLGFVALSYVLSPRNEHPGSRWDVPQALYEPIRQDAILTRRGSDNSAAKAFLAYLRSVPAVEVIEHFGYRVERADQAMPTNVDTSNRPHLSNGRN